LEDVMEFKNKGGQPNAHLSPLMKPLGLTPEEKADLVTFMKALAGAPLKITLPKLPQ
jgi:cytochrome c peroxidase